MKGTNAHQSTSPSLVCALLLIGLVFLSPSDVHSWTPAKILTHHRPIMSRNRFCSALKSFEGETQKNSWIEKQLIVSIPRKKSKSTTKSTILIKELQSILQLFFACMGMSIILISWEDISMSHPMRIESVVLLPSSSSSDFESFVLTPEFPLRWGRSTVRGLASGGTERQAITAAGDLESSTYKNLPSYNEVMLTHRTDRIPLWNNKEKDRDFATKRKDVVDSVRAVQLALFRIRDCEELARNYEWDQLKARLNDKSLRSDLQNACYILKSADGFLSREARDEIGFDWGSCAWRHCGALSDAQEAIDALEYQVGMLEPFECIYCLDVVERSLRDMLAVTNKYADNSMKVPDYIPIQRMSELSNQEDNILDGQETEYMNTLSFLRNSEF